MNSMDRNLPNRPPPIPRRAPIIAALDIGTSKVVCLIATGDHTGRARLLGIGHQRSRGIKAGMIVDPDAAEQSVRAAVGQAERMAGVTVEQVNLAVSSGRLKSQRFVARAPTESGLAGDSDVARVLEGGEAYATRGGRTLVQFHAGAWHLDGSEGVPDPRGMTGAELSADLVVVTADDGPLQNTLAVIERCYLEPHQLAATPFASAMSVTTAEERHLGVLVVDMGAGITSLAAFLGGELLVAEVLPVGGQLITFDIARRLVTPVTEAERIKSLYGTLLPALSNEHETFSFPMSGAEEGATGRISRAELRAVIEPRAAGMLALVRERLEAARIDRAALERIVLTGGGAQLEGIDGFWAEARGATVRVGKPAAIEGASPDMLGPAFATVSGLICDALQQHYSNRSVRARGWQGGGYVSWLGNLLSRARA